MQASTALPCAAVLFIKRGLPPTVLFVKYSEVEADNRVGKADRRCLLFLEMAVARP